MEMAKEKSKIAASTGICVGGRSAAADKVADAMRIAALNGAIAGEDPEVIKAKMLEARFNAKPPERR